MIGPNLWDGNPSWETWSIGLSRRYESAAWDGLSEVRAGRGKARGPRRAAAPGRVVASGPLAHQSEPRVSLPAGVQAAAKVHSLMVEEVVRTEPSPMPHRMPAACGVCGTRGSHGVWPRGDVWNGTIFTALPPGPTPMLAAAVPCAA